MRGLNEDANKNGAQPMLSRRAFLGAGAAVAVAGTAVAQAERPVNVDAAWEPTSDKVIRMGVVGGGFGLGWHWHEHPNCVVEAVSDLVPDRRDKLMERYACAKSYDCLEDLILDPNIDAVAVFTPAPDHARHMMLCMEHGKHVISACPACMRLEEAAAMKEVKERTGLKYMNAETSYYRWETITMRRLVQDGTLGRLVYTEAEYYHPSIGADKDGLSMRYGRRTWRYGFPPMLYPTHSTSFLVGVTRERLVKVSCIGTKKDDQAFKDNIYENPFANGLAMFLTDQGNAFRCNVAWDLYGHGERAQWFGTKGALYMGGSAGQPFVLKVGAESTNQMPDYWHMVPPKMRYDSGHGRSHSFLTNEFITALVEDREPAVNLYEALAFCVPGIVAHESSFRDGEQMNVPSFDPA